MSASASSPRSSALALVLSLLVAACSDSSSGPARLTAVDANGDVGSAANPTVLLKDECEPASFNAVLGPGACVGDGRVTFDQFITELAATRTVKTWLNAPFTTTTRAGTTISLKNMGGEVHTLTRVAKFGGGIVPELNALVGTDKDAPECFMLGPSDFIPGGGGTGSIPTSGLARGTHLFECCIHPWMRATVVLK